MKNSPEMIVTPIESTKLVNTEAPQKSLYEHVRLALNNYFSQLGGQVPCNIYELVLEQIEIPLLEKIMEVALNNQSKAAQFLGLSRGTLRKKLKKYDVIK